MRETGVKARLTTSHDRAAVHVFIPDPDGGPQLRSVCEGITTMPYLLEQTEDAVTCGVCRDASPEVKP